MKRWWFLVFVLVIFIFGCFREKPELNQLQVTACNAASANNNCGKLADLGLVSEEECCSALGKCCGLIIERFGSSFLK